MDEYDRNKLLVSVARLYYESDYSQEQIAKQLKLSRPYVSKLLNAAKRAGIVHIRVVDPLNTETALEKEIRERFGLKRVLVVATNDADPLKHIGESAARYLEGIIRDGDIIGTSWGDTVYHISRYLRPVSDVKNLTYVQLCGGISDVNSPVHISEIANAFSEKLGCKAYLLQLPAIVGSSELRDMLAQDVNVSNILEYGRKARIALFTVGAFGINGSRSALARAGYLSDEQVKFLSAHGAVGDICSHVINSDGEICDPELDSCTVAISLNCIREKEYRIGVAQGISKEKAIIGALKSGIMNVFITTETTALNIINYLRDKD